MGRLFVLFTLVPLMELYFLIKIGGAIGPFNTVLLIILTAFLGATLARLEGIRTMRQISNSLSQGIVPAEEMVDGLLIFAGGVMLITPGVLTDFLALFLLIPITRTYFKRWLRKWFDHMIASDNVRVHHRSGSRDDF